MTTQPLRPQPQPITPRSESPTAGHELLRRVLARRPVNDVAGLLRVLNRELTIETASTPASTALATELLFTRIEATPAPHPDPELHPWRVTVGGETALVAQRRCGWTRVDDRSTYGGMDDVVDDVLAAGGRYRLERDYRAAPKPRHGVDYVEIRLLLVAAVGGFAIQVASDGLIELGDGADAAFAEQLEDDLLSVRGLTRSDVDNSGSGFDYVLTSGGAIPADLLG